MNNQLYAGFATRAVALGIDALAINLIALLAGAAASLIASLFGHHGGLKLSEALIGAIVWGLWIATYFVTFWTLTGQTPGDRVLGIRVVSDIPRRFGVRRALGRFGGMILSALLLGAGFLLVLVDDRRRGLHDRLAHTVVRWDPPPRRSSASARTARPPDRAAPVG